MRRLTSLLSTRRAVDVPLAKSSHEITRSFQSVRRGIRTNMSTRNSNDAQAEETHDAITAEEIAGTEPPNSAQPGVDSASQKRPNACTSSSRITRLHTVDNSQCSHRTHVSIQESKVPEPACCRCAKYKIKGHESLQEHGPTQWADCLHRQARVKSRGKSNRVRRRLCRHQRQVSKGEVRKKGIVKMVQYQN